MFVRVNCESDFTELDQTKWNSPATRNRTWFYNISWHIVINYWLQDQNMEYNFMAMRQLMSKHPVLERYPDSNIRKREQRF